MHQDKKLVDGEIILLYIARKLSSCYLSSAYIIFRHYTFYIWRKIIARKEPWSKFLLIPVYFYGGFCCCHSIRKTNIIFKLSYVVFVFLNLCPQLLLEFRYFVIPYFMYRLQVRPTNWTKLVLETVLYLSVNAITIYLYVMKPFTWENEPEQTQRFMW